jgi:uncharacterized membrane protein
MKNITTIKLVVTAMFMALTMVATMFIRIPLPLGYVNLGDAMVFLSVFVLGPICGTIASGVGSGLADLFGYATYAPGTLVIKSAMVIVTYLIYKIILKTTNKKMLAEIVGGIVGVLVMAFGYFIYETLLFTTAGVAILNAPWNLLQGGVGLTISVLIMRVLVGTKVIERIGLDK